MTEMILKKETSDITGTEVGRIGLFGGTFNPVHLGHLRSMVEVKEKLKLDQLIVIPSKEPPHKKRGCILNAKDRVSMIEIALSGMENFKISDVEILRAGPSYTIDTVKYFIRDLCDPGILYFIMGLDAFLEIDTWRDFKELFSLIPIAIMIRPGAWQKNDPSPVKVVQDYILSRVSDGYTYSDAEAVFFHSGLKPVHMINVTALEISSTRIRHYIKNGRTIKYLVTKEVENYIFDKGLYR